MVLTYFSLLMPAFALLSAPIDLASLPSPLIERSPTTPYYYEVPGFGGVLEPRYIFRATAFDQ